jgi:hypothetical protein
MRNMLALYIFVIFSFLSCSDSHLTFLTDPWWLASYDPENRLEIEILKGSIKKFKRIESITVSTSEEAMAILNNLEEKEGNQTIVVTPVFYSLIKNKPDLEKKINYIILNGFYDVPADNIIAVYSFREEVYYQAGVKAALFSKNNDNCKVASVFYNGSLIRRSEKERFIEGYNSVGNSGELINFEQQTYTGGEKLKKFIESAPEKGVGLYFFSASSLNPYCYDLAISFSVSISGENLYSSGISNELVEFSVDDDMIEIIQTAVKKGLDGEINHDFPVKALIRERGIHF